MMLDAGKQIKRPVATKAAFIENKLPDLKEIAGLLDRCAEVNSWANRGPLYAMLREEYAAHVGLAEDLVMVPMANGGLALEAMARLHDQRAGRRLRWLGSAFSFQNLARGYFSQMQLVGCTAAGLIDIDAIRALDPDTYDGIVVTNAFGLHDDFTAIAAFAKAQNKALLIDNAAGMHSEIPNLPWQSFSLHQTKPYGAGEGGLAVVPFDDQEDLYEIVNYGAKMGNSPDWLLNGKISDISCAFLIDRLRRVDVWRPRYLAARQRIEGLATGLGLVPLVKPDTDLPLMNLPLLAPVAIPEDRILTTNHIVFAKYYKPLSQEKTSRALFDRLMNVPCHPDMDRVSDEAIVQDMRICLGVQAQA